MGIHGLLYGKIYYNIFIFLLKSCNHFYAIIQTARLVSLIDYLTTWTKSFFRKKSSSY